MEKRFGRFYSTCSLRLKKDGRRHGPVIKALGTLFLFLILLLPQLYVSNVFAATIFDDGFESGNFSKWSPVVGNPTITSGDAHHGTYKAVLNASGQYAQARFTNVDHCFMRAYVMFKSFPASGLETPILGVYNTSGVYMSEARVGNVSGTMKWRLRYYHNGAHYTVTSEQQNPVLNTWYCVEVEGKSNSTTNSESRIYINGNELTDVSQTGKNNNYLINCAYIWESVTGSVTLWYDCVVVDTAYIGPEKYTLTVATVGSGSVDKNPNQVNYTWATNVTLTANANVGWTFDAWSGDASGSVNPTTVNMTSDKSVTATFTQNVYTLTVNTDGNGVVNLNNSGPYHHGDIVQLNAVPASDWSFSYWSGDLSGSTNPTSLLIDGDCSVTAHFAMTGGKPMLNVDPENRTCRKFDETFPIQITITNASSVEDFAFEIHYDGTLLDVAGVAWNAFDTGTYTADEVNGILTGYTSGSPVSGNLTLITITFNATYYHIWKDESQTTGWKNIQIGTMFIQNANLSYPSSPDLQYERGGINQIDVGPDHAYTFSPIQGDVDNNGVIDITDLRTLAAYYDVKQGDPLWSAASAYDLKGDEIIDVFDLVIISTNYGFTYP